MMKLYDVVHTRLCLDMDESELLELMQALQYATGESSVSCEYSEWVCELKDKVCERVGHMEKVKMKQ